MVELHVANVIVAGSSPVSRSTKERLVAMSRRISTRSFEECQEIVRMWSKGSRSEVIEILGGEPTAEFLRTFRAPPRVPEILQKAKSPATVSDESR